MKVNLLLVLILINFLLNPSQALKCSEETIDHCTQCDTGENSDTCSSCENKYFQFFNNLLCLPCNDPTFGQIGCEGNCEGTNYIKTRNVLCEEGGCKEGYYYMNGICTQCSEVSPGCSNCTYNVKLNNENEKEKFVCNKCLSDEYRLNENGLCEKCYLANCEKCFFNKSNKEKVECEICSQGFYKNSEGICVECKDVSIHGGHCQVCSDNETQYEQCYCNGGYTKIGNSTCFDCKPGCYRCDYNSEINDTECISCYSNYALAPNKTCIYCGEGCSYCDLDNQNNPICKYCNSGTFSENNKCLICQRGCSKCKMDKNEKICTECYYNWALNSENNNCTYCSDIEDTGGEGCSRCIYNKNKNKYECLECKNWYDHYYYAYINNTYQCLDNRNSSKTDLYGCLEANYNSATKKYECYQCKGDFMQVKNEKNCINLEEINLSSNCLEVENINNKEAPLYSCSKCPDEFAFVTINSNGVKNCYERKDNFAYCLEGKIENENQICTKCIEYATLNKENICECNFGFFGYKNLYCYECDDKIHGNPGCVASKGCSYFLANDELDCNECKEGYFKYTKGQCYSCSTEVPNCDKCSLKITGKEEQIICENCLSLFTLNNKNTCELNECEEYPDISPGCIICKDKLNKYKSNNKCQTCKYGYFLTKEEKCVYCRSEEYGGPACYECGYEQNEAGKDTNNIICKNCYSYFDYNDYEYYRDYYEYFSSALSSKGKCYNCKYDLSDNCIKCEFIKDQKNNEKLACTQCRKGYYLDTEGKCINYINKIIKVPNCYKMIITIDNYRFSYYIEDNDGYININYQTNMNVSYFYEIMRNIKSPIKGTCEYCSDEYYLNEKGECEYIDLNNCTGKSLYNRIEENNGRTLENACSNLCNYNEFPFIYLLLKNNSIDLNKESYDNIEKDIYRMDDLFDILNVTNDETKKFIFENPLCYNISDENLRNKFYGCQYVIYNPLTKSFQCYQCYGGCYLDAEKKICLINYDDEDINNIYCYHENIGTDSNPIYSCLSCYDDYATLVQYDNGIKRCIYNDKNLDNCINVSVVSTYYINNIYNCTSCGLNHISYFSKYYQRNMCHNVFEKIIKSKNISLDLFENEEYIPIEENGICKKNYFTPDGNKCYKCDNENVGMPGCKGECSFSLNREKTILCQDECKDGYIESSQGICETCDSVNEGCYQCHYENSYPTDYIGIKRERRFVCDFCKDGYIKSSEGKCLTCRNLGLKNCEQCPKDDLSGNYKCTKCKKNYALNDYGNCKRCIVKKTVVNNKCIYCDEPENGGVKNCKFCQANEKGDGVICKQCYQKYILFIGNNTCLERDNNKELEQFDSCLELKSDGNKLICSRCKPEFSLIKIDNELKCIYTPTLFDSNLKAYYYANYIRPFIEIGNMTNLRENNYLFRQTQFLPCKEAINLGTTENPLYSCAKCYNIFENEEYDFHYYDGYYDFDIYDYFYDNGYYDYYYYYADFLDEEERYISDSMPVKIDDKMTKNSYCIRAKKETENCTEAIYKISNGKEIYSCTKCMKDNDLFYNGELDIYYCLYKNAGKCLVDYCKTCEPNNAYFCSNCVTSEYEVNKYSGSCVKKTEIEPAITWKDIYRLNMNGQKEINGRIIQGPSLKLRGITTSQINSRHAFLVYLTFKLKHSLRNLQETLRIPAICEINDENEETNDDVNIVDYDCIGNETVKGNYELIDIEGNYSNINNNIINNPSKNNSNYTYENIPILFMLQNNNLNNKTFNNKIIDFSLYGKLNKIKTASNKIITNHNNIEMELNEIKEKALCNFTKDEKLNANFSCNLEMNNNASSSNLTFKNNEIKIGDVNLYINELNKINFSYEKEERINPIYKKKSSKNHTAIIVVCIIAGVVVIAAAVFTLLYIFKWRKKNNVGDKTNAADISEVDIDHQKNASNVDMNK